MRVAALFLVLTMPCFAAAAQSQVAQSFEQLIDASPLKEGDTVWILFDLDGSGAYEELKGKLISLTGATIGVRPVSLPSGLLSLDTGLVGDDGRIELPEDRVRRIDREFADSLANGVGFGALIGFAALGIPALIGSADCPGEGVVAELCIDFGLALAIGAAGAGIGAGVGAGVDAATKSRAVMYSKAQDRVGGVTLALSPIVTGQRRGLAGTLRW